MAQLEVTATSTPSTIVDSGAMLPGEIGEIIDHPITAAGRRFLMRAYSSWIMLDNPKTDWTVNPQYKVRILQPGEAVTLKVK